MNLVQTITAEQQQQKHTCEAGDTVRVHVRIYEGDKARIQIFEGVIIAMRRGGSGPSITVRKISYGIGVERVFPLNARTVEKIEVQTRNKIRRAKLFYLRNLRGKAARLKERESARRPATTR